MNGDQEKYQKSKESSGEGSPSQRGFAVGLILSQIGLMIAYGIQGVFQEEATPVVSAYPQIMSLIMMALFTIVGFGLLLSSYKHATWLGMASAVLVVAVSIHLSPLVQTLFFQTFNSGFRSNPLPADVGVSIQQFWTYFSEADIVVNVYKMRVTFLSCISILTLMTAVIGRINLVSVILMVTLFQFAWNVNFNLLIYLASQYNDFNKTERNSPIFFDAFGSSYVYLFAGAFGLVFACILPSKFPAGSSRNVVTGLSGIPLMGTAFIFSAFVFTQSNFFAYSPLGQNRQTFSIILAMIGGVGGTYAGSAFAGKGRVGYKQAMVGTISGGVVMGSVAPLIYNPGIMLMIGVANGFVNGIYMRTIHKSINKNYVKDAMGLFGPFFLSALIGTMVVVPAVINYGSQVGNKFPTTNATEPSPDMTSSYAGWQLIFVGISIAIGIVSGLITGLLTVCGTSNQKIGSNYRYFGLEYGLHQQPEKYSHSISESGTNQNLKNEREAF